MEINIILPHKDLKANKVIYIFYFVSILYHWNKINYFKIIIKLTSTLKLKLTSKSTLIFILKLTTKLSYLYQYIYKKIDFKINSKIDLKSDIKNKIKIDTGNYYIIHLAKSMTWLPGCWPEQKILLIIKCLSIARFLPGCCQKKTRQRTDNSGQPVAQGTEQSTLCVGHWTEHFVKFFYWWIMTFDEWVNDNYCWMMTISDWWRLINTFSMEHYQDICLSRTWNLDGGRGRYVPGRDEKKKYNNMSRSLSFEKEKKKPIIWSRERASWKRKFSR
jgi:hypothetical protein